MAVDHETSEPEIGPLRDTSLAWRLSVWGGATTVALATAILLTQTDGGAKRLQMAFSHPAAQTVTQADFTPPARPAAEEIASLQAQVRDLTTDRERLNARVASLEQNLSDVTGSIKRELAIVAATAPASKPAPAVAPPATTETTERAEVAPAEVKPEPKPETKVGAKLEAAPSAVPTQAPSEQAAPVAPKEMLVAARPDNKPPSRDAAPAPLARLPMTPIATAPAGTPATVRHTGKEVAIDLGGAHSMEILLARWLAVKANFGPLLHGMSPLAVRDQRRGAIPFRLIVGPLPNAAAAAQVCARFAASHVTCRATKFEGEQLAQQ